MYGETFIELLAIVGKMQDFVRLLSGEDITGLFLFHKPHSLYYYNPNIYHTK